MLHTVTHPGRHAGCGIPPYMPPCHTIEGVHTPVCLSITRFTVGLASELRTRFTVGWCWFHSNFRLFLAVLTRMWRFRRLGTGLGEPLRTVVSCLSAPFCTVLATFCSKPTVNQGVSLPESREVYAINIHEEGGRMRDIHPFHCWRMSGSRAVWCTLSVIKCINVRMWDVRKGCPTVKRGGEEGAGRVDLPPYHPGG